MHNKDFEKAFNDKYLLYSDMLYKISYIHLGNKSDAEDVLQEVFTKLLYKAPQFKNTEHEKAWLIRVAVNACKDMRKCFYKRNVVSIDDVQISRIQDFNEQSEIMFKIMNLPDKYKTPIYLFYYDEFSVEEISKILKIGISAVKMRLSRGRELLRFELEESFYEKRRTTASN